MTSLDAKRKERARNGSRRKRDLEAAQPDRPDWDAYVAEHFPGEVYSSARAAAEMVYMAKRPAERALPDPEKVRAYMQSRGWLREQLETVEGGEPVS